MIRARATLRAWGRRPGRQAEVEAILDPFVYVGVVSPALVMRLGVRVNRAHWTGRPHTYPIAVLVAGRRHIADFAIGEPGCATMLPATIMAALDLIADPATGYLAVNPASPDRPTLRL